jgi:chromosome segregation ATPase
MSQLELLKNHIEHMNTRIKTIETEINEKKQIIINYENQKIEIETVLNHENALYSKLVENHAYLCDVKQNTSSNYTQLEEAATTLLDILKNKCDGI